MDNIIKVIFDPDSATARISDRIYQYDYGQTLEIHGLDLPATVAVEYTINGSAPTIDCTGTTTEGILTVPIPNEILEQSGDMKAYIRVMDAKTGSTKYIIFGMVWEREKPGVHNTPEEEELFARTIEIVNNSASSAEAARAGAEGARDQAQQTADSLEQTSAERLAQMGAIQANAQDYATQAGQSAQAAKSSERAAQMAQEDAAEILANAQDVQGEVNADSLAVAADRRQAEQLAAQTAADREQTGKDAVQTAADRRATGADKDSTAADRQAVAADRKSVEDTAAKALTEISAAKTGAVQAVEDNKAASVQTINDTGSAQVTEITDTGTTQVQAVQAEGATQVQAVQEAAAEITADRQQIQANTSDISALSAGLDVSATAIIRNASGSLIGINDSAGKPLRGMSVYGKSRQNKTTGANLADFRNVTPMIYKGLTISTDSNGVVIVNGTSTTAENEPYRFTFGGKDIDLSLLEVGQTYLSNHSIEYYLPDGSKKYGTFVFTNDIIRVRPYVQLSTRNTGATFNNVKYKPMLYKDTGIVPDWEPFTGGKSAPIPDYPQEIENAGDSGSIVTTITGSNMCNLRRMYENADVVQSVDDNKVIFANNIYGADPRLKKTYGHLGTGIYTIYALAYGTAKIIRIEIYINETKIADTMNKNNEASLSFATDGGVMAIKIHTYESVQNSAEKVFGGFCNLMLNKGSTALPWQPYRSQSLTLQTLNGLPGIPVSSGGNYTDTNGQQWVCDEINLERGVRVKRVESCVFDGSEDEQWSVINSSGGTNKKCVSIKLVERGIYQYGTPIITNYSIYKSWHETAITNFINEYVWFTFGHENAGFASLEDFKAKLAECPMHILYAIATPIETPLTEEELKQYQKLRTYPSTTHIMTDDPVEPEIAVEYVADTEIWTHNLLSPLEDRIASLEQQALQKI